MKKIFVLLSVIVLSFTLIACNNEKEFNFEQGYITVGLEADYPPFNWMETTSNDYNHPLHGQTGAFVAGYDVEVAKFIAEELNLELRIKQIDWKSLVPAVKSSEIDLIIAGMSPTSERLETIDFTSTYYVSNHVVVVLSSGKFADVESLDGLKGAKGVGQISTVYADLVNYVEEHHQSISLPVRDSVPLIVNDIIGGSADFTIVEKPVALGMVANNDKLKIILDVEENIFNVADEDRELAIGLKKIDTNLKEKINAILEKITNEQRNLWMNQAVINSNK